MTFESASHRETITLGSHVIQRGAERLTTNGALPVRKEYLGNIQTVSNEIRKLVNGRVVLATNNSFIVGAADDDEMDQLDSELVAQGAQSPERKKIETLDI